MALTTSSALARRALTVKNPQLSGLSGRYTTTERDLGYPLALSRSTAQAPADSISVPSTLTPASPVPTTGTSTALSTSPTTATVTERFGALGGGGIGAGPTASETRAGALGTRAGMNEGTTQSAPSLGQSANNAAVSRISYSDNPSLQSAAYGALRGTVDVGSKAYGLGASLPESLGYGVVYGGAPLAAVYGVGSLISQALGKPLGEARKTAAQDALARARESGDINAEVAARGDLAEGLESYNQGAWDQTKDMALNVLGLTDPYSRLASKVENFFSFKSPEEQAQDYANIYAAENMSPTAPSVPNSLGNTTGYDVGALSKSLGVSQPAAEQAAAQGTALSGFYGGESDYGDTTTDAASLAAASPAAEISSPDMAQARQEAIAQLGSWGETGYIGPEGFSGYSPSSGLGGQDQGWGWAGSGLTGVHSFGGRGYSGGTVAGYGGTSDASSKSGGGGFGGW